MVAGALPPVDFEPAAMVPRAGLVMTLRARGIVDRALLDAMEQVPRHAFVDTGLRRLADLDVPLPIELGQTQEAPTHIARVIQALALGPEHRVLEIGTGSGYMTAILVQMARSVVSLDRYRTLGEAAADRLERLRLPAATCVQADGLHGYPPAGPYDVIVSTLAFPYLPPALMPQLKPNGRIVLALAGDPLPRLLRIDRADGGERIEDLGAVRACALRPRLAAAL